MINMIIIANKIQLFRNKEESTVHFDFIEQHRYQCDPLIVQIEELIFFFHYSNRTMKTTSFALEYI